MSEDAGCAERFLCALFATAVKPISDLRLLIIGLCAMVLALGVPAEAQQPKKVPRIGYLTDSMRPQSDVEALQGALRKLGYVEGQNIAFALRFAEKPEQYAALAAELVGLKVDVIVARTGFMTMAAKHATRTIPIVMVTSGDAVQQGIVASLARPGGNVTGLTAISPDLTRKWLEFLKEVVPKLARVAVLRCPMVAGRPNVVDQFQWRELQGGADVLGVQLQSLEVRNSGDFKALFAAAVRERAEALVTLDCVYTNMAQTQVAALAATHRLPGMYFYQAAVEAGGLMSDTAVWGGGQWHRVAVYVDKILKGAKPADLPVEQPMQFEFIINLKAAKQIGLTIPPNVLARADKVIK